MFNHVFKHREVSWQQDAWRSIFDELREIVGNVVKQWVRRFNHILISTVWISLCQLTDWFVSHVCCLQLFKSKFPLIRCNTNQHSSSLLRITDLGTKPYDKPNIRRPTKMVSRNHGRLVIHKTFCTGLLNLQPLRRHWIQQILSALIVAGMVSYI